MPPSMVRAIFPPGTPGRSRIWPEKFVLVVELPAIVRLANEPAEPHWLITIPSPASDLIVQL